MTIPDWVWKVLTVGLGAWVAWIGLQQYWATRDKLRLDLFDRRMKVFEEVKALIAIARNQAQVDTGELQLAIASAHFLFGDDVQAYLAEVERKLTAVREYGPALRVAAAIEDLDEGDEAYLLVTWLRKQPNRMTQVFAPYLSFADARSK